MRKQILFFIFLLLGSDFSLCEESEIIVGLGSILVAENDYDWTTKINNWFVVIEVQQIFCGNSPSPKILIGFEGKWDRETGRSFGIPGVRRNGTLDPKVWKSGQEVVFRAKPYDPNTDSCTPIVFLRPMSESGKEEISWLDVLSKDRSSPDWIQKFPWQNKNLERFRPIPIFCIKGGDNLLLVHPYPKYKKDLMK